MEVAIDNLLITTESESSDAMVPIMEVAGHPFNNHVVGDNGKGNGKSTSLREVVSYGDCNG